MRKESPLLLMTLLPVVTVAIEKGENSRHAGKLLQCRAADHAHRHVAGRCVIRSSLPKENLLSDVSKSCVCLLQMRSRATSSAPRPGA